MPDPRPLTLAGAKLLPRAELTHRQYLRTPVSLLYWREYELRRGRLAGSRIFWLRTMTQSFKRARLARRDQAHVASTRGSEAIAHRLLGRWFRRTELKPTDVKTRPLPTSDADTAGFQAYFDAPHGRVEGVMVSVRRGRLRSSVAVFGFDRDVRPEDVLALRGRLRARLEAA